MDISISIHARTPEHPDDKAGGKERFLDGEAVKHYIETLKLVAMMAPRGMKVNFSSHTSQGTIDEVGKVLFPEEAAFTLNDHCDKECYVEGDVVKCHGIGNTFTVVIDGFPVSEDADRPGVYFLYENVFNEGEAPGSWDHTNYRGYEENQLTPWLQSMGFTDITWRMGESDSFGPLSRVATMKRGKNRFEYIYG